MLPAQLVLWTDPVSFVLIPEDFSTAPVQASKLPADFFLVQALSALHQVSLLHLQVLLLPLLFHPPDPALPELTLLVLHPLFPALSKQSHHIWPVLFPL